MKPARKKPEIMSPAGYWPQVHAAIESGADAVYFGLKQFTARAKVGFDLEELPQVMQTLHRRGVKGYLTFNTLVFDNELRQAAETLTKVHDAGVDALIVQDWAIADLVHRYVPDLTVHGSTQMSITNAAGVRMAQSFGAQRVVLARELSLKEIEQICNETDCELEIFVHGALCVSYSGQCFSSEAWGGRSANRGACAQACRLPYGLVVDDVLKPLGDARYLLSPGDLFALEQVPQIVQLGIHCLKIEGRYKDADYVALTTQAYRAAVDAAWQGIGIDAKSKRLELEQSYSRGLGAYFISGTNHQRVVRGRTPNHRGIKVGEVVRIEGDQVVIQPDPILDRIQLKPGDGLVFDSAAWRSPTEPEEGGRLYEVSKVKNHLHLGFANGQIQFQRIRPGDWVWRNHDPELDKKLKPILQATQPIRKQPVRVVVKARPDALLQMEWQLVDHPLCTVLVQSEQTLATSRNHSLDPQQIRNQLERLGNTPYQLASLQLEIEGNPFLPVSLLNKLRQEAVERLQTLQAGHVTPLDPKPLLDALPSLDPIQKSGEWPIQLHILVRTPEQLQAALDLEPASITLDYLDLFHVGRAVDQVKAAGLPVRIASPRILKPGEEKIAQFLVKQACPVLVRANGLLEMLPAEAEWVGDFSLNAANRRSAQILLDLGLKRITPTHDLNAEQVRTLAQAVGPEALEVVIYQHLPVFHTEHCVFCRFLSTGTSYKDCGRPCEEHKVALQDQQGRQHPVIADVGCRNTVFGWEAQEASRHLSAWLQAGLHHFRLEFTHETGDQLIQIVSAFRTFFDGSQPLESLQRKLKTVHPTTEGSLFVPPDFLGLPV